MNANANPSTAPTGAPAQDRGPAGGGCLAATLDFEKIPPELKSRPQWVCWSFEEREGKPTKVPKNPKTGGNAMANDPGTWGEFDLAVRHWEAHKNNGIAGIGYEFGAADPFTGVDLDKIRNEETGEIEEWAWRIIKPLNSYTEVSPSGRGVHIIIKGAVPHGGNKRGQVEMYSQRHYFTMTGHHLEGTPATIEPRQAELEALHGQIFRKPKPPPKPAGAGPALDLSDFALVDKASQRDPVFDRLWKGDTAGRNPSEADYALVHKLAWWTNKDPARIDRLFRQSGLCQDPDRLKKWDRLATGTINKAIANTEGGYDPRSHQALIQAPEAPRQAIFQVIKPTAPTIQFVTGRELESIEFKDLAWVVPEILPEGLCLLSARPKKGKTWCALGISVAKSTGGYALGKGELRLTQGKVLYLCLEDKLRRAQKRLRILLGDDPFPEDLILAESWPRLDKGGLEALQDFLKEHDDCKMVVVDSFAKIKPPRPKNIDAYDFDMAVGGVLQSLAQERQICLLLIYHNRKAEAEDPLDEVIGGTGLTGAVDAVLVLRRGRGQADATLFVTGRDVSEQELALKFNPEDGAWELLGDAAQYAKSPERLEIIRIIQEHGPKTSKELSEIIGKKQNSIKGLLFKMAKDQELKSVGGRYEIIKK